MMPRGVGHSWGWTITHERGGRHDGTRFYTRRRCAVPGTALGSLPVHGQRRRHGCGWSSASTWLTSTSPRAGARSRAVNGYSGTGSPDPGHGRRRHRRARTAPGWYVSFLQNIVQPNASLFATLVALGELAIGLGAARRSVDQVSRHSRGRLREREFRPGRCRLGSNPALIILGMLLALAWAECRLDRSRSMLHPPWVQGRGAPDPGYVGRLGSRLPIGRRHALPKPSGGADSRAQSIHPSPCGGSNADRMNPRRCGAGPESPSRRRCPPAVASGERLVAVARRGKSRRRGRRRPRPRMPPRQPLRPPKPPRPRSRRMALAEESGREERRPRRRSSSCRREPTLRKRRPKRRCPRSTRSRHSRKYRAATDRAGEKR